MSFCLYNKLPTELVWKIYDINHRSLMKDLRYEFLVQSCEYSTSLYPYACIVGCCECGAICETEEGYEWNDGDIPLVPSFLKAQRLVVYDFYETDDEDIIYNEHFSDTDTDTEF